MDTELRERLRQLEARHGVRLGLELEAELWDAFCTSGRYLILMQDSDPGARPCAHCKQPIAGEICPGCGEGKRWRGEKELFSRIASLAVGDEPRVKDKIHRLAQIGLDDGRDLP